MSADLLARLQTDGAAASRAATEAWHALLDAQQTAPGSAHGHLAYIAARQRYNLALARVDAIRRAFWDATDAAEAAKETA
jgi:hypothetical protein